MRRERCSYLPACSLFTAAIIAICAPCAYGYRPVAPEHVVDLSPTVSPDHYQNWPGGQLHHQPLIVPYIQHGPGALAADLIMLDENTGTQTDCPPHMMPPQESGLPNAHYYGSLTCDRVPAWGWVGEVFKIDGRDILDKAPDGSSPLFSVQLIKQAEANRRPLQPGDAALYWSGYDDVRDRPQPDDGKLIVEPLAGRLPGWPAPDFDAADYVGSKGVWLMGIDSPSMGGLGSPAYTREGPAGMFQNPLTLESHLGHFKHGASHTEGLVNLDQVPDGSLYVSLPVNHRNEGMIFTEFLTGVGQLPATGSFYIFLNPKIAGNHGGPGRAIAILP